MQLTITQFEFGERPQVTMPTPMLLSLLKEQGIRKLVSDHYDLLRISKVGNLFPTDDDQFEIAKSSSADFFIQILGGPSYFNQNRGQPRLPDRHAPFAITLEARNIWLDCYRNVLLKLDLPEDVIMSFWNYINVFSIKMVNTPGS